MILPFQINAIKSWVFFNGKWIKSILNFNVFLMLYNKRGGDIQESVSGDMEIWWLELINMYL